MLDQCKRNQAAIFRQRDAVLAQLMDITDGF